MPAARQLPIDPDLPPDQPLEPGSGPPTLRANPAARIAASEAALGGARPAAPASGPSNKSNFIAAARRAAQAATQERPARAPRSAADFMDAEAGDATPKARTSLFKRVKSLFLAASVIAIVIGGVQIASNFVDFGGPNDKVAQVNDLVPEKTAAKAPTDEIEAPATVAAATEPAPVPPTAAVQEAPRPSSSPTGLPSVALVQPGANVPSPPLWSAPGAALPGFATGSISRPGRRRANSTANSAWLCRRHATAINCPPRSAVCACAAPPPPATLPPPTKWD